MLTIGSLFSGIGGLELGLEWAGLGPVLWQVEKDEFCRRVLAKHWPEVPRYEDVRSVRASQLGAVDLICGGFPCQDLSTAGDGAGLNGRQSGLWWEFWRILKEARPRFAVIENVASGASRWLRPVRHHVHMLGYRTRALGIAARDMGAPHARKRVFILAYAAQIRPVRLEAVALRDANPLRLGRWSNEPVVDRVAYGVPDAMAKRGAIGNAIVPQCAQVVGEVIRLMLNKPNVSPPTSHAHTSEAP